ncbi:MAG: HEAT repeat domain-containing protein, partial [Nodularia sp. (in: Bacteria)]
MLITPRHTNKLSLFFLFCFTLLLTLFLSLPWVSATEKAKPQDWQINGIVAALDDGHDKVKEYAFTKLREYDLKNLKFVVKKPEDVAEKAANVFKDEKVDSGVRYGAAEALGNMGEAATKYVPDILNIIQDEQVDSGVRYGAAVALGNMGEAATKYLPDIANILKDEQVDSGVRSSAAVALGNMGEAAT